MTFEMAIILLYFWAGFVTFVSLRRTLKVYFSERGSAPFLILASLITLVFWPVVPIFLLMFEPENLR